MAHKLLLADDSITIQRVIELTFAEEDVQVFAVGDGKHAIDRIQADRPDIVLADVGMPERDGYEVAAFIKGNPQLAHIPVLLLTGAFEPIDEVRARAVGCDGVLVKPFEPQMVINRVKDLLAGRRSGAAGNANLNLSGDPGTASGQESPQAPPPPTVDPPTQAEDSLEDYFDRLDAAFATLGGEPGGGTSQPEAGGARTSPVAVAESQSATAEDFASWDPDLAGDARRPGAHVPLSVAHEPVVSSPPAPAARAESVPVTVSAPPEAPTPAYAMPEADVPREEPYSPPATVPTAVSTPAQISLADAFVALLAAEHGQPFAPPTGRPAAAPSPEVVEDVVRRVLDRLQEQDMRQTVLDVAERLVREEIDRIKRANG